MEIYPPPAACFAPRKKWSKERETTMYLSPNYTENVRLISSLLRADESFDIIERRLAVSDRQICFFYIDGFVKDGELQRVMQTFLSLKEIGNAEYTERRLPYVEVDRECDVERLVTAVLSGQTLLLAETFGADALLIDLRTYPARDTQ